MPFSVLPPPRLSRLVTEKVNSGGVFIGVTPWGIVSPCGGECCRAPGSYPRGRCDSEYPSAHFPLNYALPCERRALRTPTSFFGMMNVAECSPSTVIGLKPFLSSRAKNPGEATHTRASGLSSANLDHDFFF